ncbi:protein phosphatase 2C [Ancylostoma ceylanicum]|uniref:Protein phosphatase 2C n=1 Tax=Ancylostoma ceylanicum TaxID=53326 RepID=A0A0D6LU60_9BILA|nr:protein phosphatase 2C [Ancylostoma ceylanicum]
MLNRRLLTEWRRAIRNSRWNADAHLRAHERSVPVDQDAIVRVDTCQLAANSPIEVFLFSCKINSQRQQVIDYYKAFTNNKDLHTVRDALKFAFETCDDNLCRAALPDNRGKIDRLSVMTAASGSCATLAHIRKRNLHVANVGDGAAVLGVVNPNGSVIARQLSRAHCIDNADEVQRIRASHPTSETHVLRGGRLLGELYPLRAFGDVRFKWPLDLQKVVLEPLGSPAPPNLYTPPYLTVSPEVFYHKLTANDKFLVLATDGLWEWLDPDTVVRLVHDHALGTMTLQPYQPKSGTPLKQVPPGRARNYRDDISVVVIHFNEKYLEEDDEVVTPQGLEMQAK